MAGPLSWGSLVLTLGVCEGTEGAGAVYACTGTLEFATRTASIDEGGNHDSKSAVVIFNR